MGEGTNYVIEQLGLALKNQQDQYSQLVQHAQGLQSRIDQLEAAQKSAPDEENVDKQGD